MPENVNLAPFGRKLIELLYDAEPKAEAQVAVAVDGANQSLAKERAELTIPADAKNHQKSCQNLYES